MLKSEDAKFVPQEETGEWGRGPRRDWDAKRASVSPSYFIKALLSYTGTRRMYKGQEGWTTHTVRWNYDKWLRTEYGPRLKTPNIYSSWLLSLRVGFTNQSPGRVSAFLPTILRRLFLYKEDQHENRKVVNNLSTQPRLYNTPSPSTLGTSGINCSAFISAFSLKISNRFSKYGVRRNSVNRKRISSAITCTDFSIYICLFHLFKN